MYDIYGKAKVTGNFGEKRSYYRPGKFHEGDDIALAMNSPINARLGGTILNVKSDPNGYGNYVDIDHGNGIITRYAHANSFNVKPGQIVKEGEQIGLVGSTGRSTGPHLHTELIIDGIKKNPKELEKYMANLVNIPKPKEAPKAPDLRGTEDLINDLANQAVNEQNKMQAAEQDPLRNTINELIKTKLLNPVEVPKYTELKDILSAEKGDKLGVFADFLKNPQTIRTIGNLFGGTYMDRNGNFIHGLEKQARQEEALMKSEQEKALDEARQQNYLAGNVYNAFKQTDIADMQDERARELAEASREFQRQENELNRDLRREEYKAQREEKAADRAERRAERAEDREDRRAEKAADRANALEIAKIHYGTGNTTGGSLTGGAVNLNNIKMTAAERKSLTEGKTTLSNIEAGLQALEKNPDAYSYMKGLLSANIANRLDPKGVGTRAQIDNITAVYRKWLTGAQMSDNERKAYERFLPAPTDNYQIIKAKLNGMKDAIQRSNDAILSNYGVSGTSSNDPLGLGL